MNNLDELEDEFEERLKRDLERVPAPEGFADRVLGRVATQQHKGRLVAMPKRATWLAIAAMLLVGVMLGGWQWKQQEVRKERQQAEVVQRQFDMAMQVTQRTLAGVQERVGKTVRDSVRQ